VASSIRDAEASSTADTDAGTTKSSPIDDRLCWEVWRNSAAAMDLPRALRLLGMGDATLGAMIGLRVGEISGVLGASGPGAGDAAAIMALLPPAQPSHADVWHDDPTDADRATLLILHQPLDATAQLWAAIRTAGSRDETLTQAGRDVLGLLAAAMQSTQRDTSRLAHDRAVALRRILGQVPGALFRYVLRPNGEAQIDPLNVGCSELWELPLDMIARDPNSVWTRIHPDDRDSLTRSIRLSAERLIPWRSEYRLMMPDRRVKYVEARGTPERRADGAIEWFTVALETTELSKARQSALESQQIHEHALQASRMGLWILDVVGNTIRYDMRAAEILGRRAEDINNTPVDLARTFRVADHREEADRNLNDVLEGRSNYYRSEHQILRPDGSTIWVYSQGRVIGRQPNGKPSRIVGTLQDLTEQKINERKLRDAASEAEAANKAKSLFLANMSHEIRTPLNGVLGMADVMALGELSDQQREYLGIIQESGRNLLTVLNDIIEYARIESDKVKIETEPFNLTSIINRVETIYRLKASDKGLKLHVIVSGEADGWRLGDEHRVQQILHNLLSNAVKFTSTGQVDVVIDTDALDPDVISLHVADTGIGMSESQLDNLFTHFNQADSSFTRRFGGTGLGLAITKGLIEAMGGEISVDSTPGLGTVFSLQLPLPRDPARTSHETTDGDVDTLDPTKPTDYLRDVCILSVEDNALIRRVLQAQLTSLGAKVAFADNGAMGVTAFQRGDFDLVLMDIQMPVMDGIQAFRAIRRWETNHNRAKTPIVAITGNALSHQTADYRNIGFDDCLTKPVQQAPLKAALSKLLRRAQREG